MNAPVQLTPKQEQFIAHACAFIGTKPPQQELDKLLTLATMRLPEPMARMIAKRATGGAVTDHAPTDWGD